MYGTQNIWRKFGTTKKEKGAMGIDEGTGKRHMTTRHFRARKPWIFKTDRVKQIINRKDLLVTISREGFWCGIFRVKAVKMRTYPVPFRANARYLIFQLNAFSFENWDVLNH